MLSPRVMPKSTTDVPADTDVDADEPLAPCPHPEHRLGTHGRCLKTSACLSIGGACLGTAEAASLI